MGLNVKDLIEGKIYISISSSNNGLIIFKANRNERLNICYYISFINVDTKSFILDGCFNTEKALQNIREATQDEIEWLEACEKANKYVDKPVKPEFIVGKWYKVTSGSGILNKPWYIKDNLTFCKTTEGSFGDEGYYAFTLIDISEIQQYLPENHIDRLPIKQSLKVGDKVKVLRRAERDEEGWNNTWMASMNDAIGKVFIIEEDNENKGFLLNHKSELNFPKHVLELVVESKSEYLKPEELVEGEWYILTTTSNSEFKALVKFKEIKNKSILYKGQYYNYNLGSKCGNNPQGLCSVDNIEELLPADPQEVLKYFPEEKINNKLTFEEALIECKKRYLIGTKFYGVNKTSPDGDFGQIHIIKGDNFVEYKKGIYKDKEAIAECNTSGILWYNGVFAEIVEESLSVVDKLKPLQEEKYNQIRENTYSALTSHKPKRTKLQLFEDLSSIVPEELVVLTVKSKINKNNKK